MKYLRHWYQVQLYVLSMSSYAHIAYAYRIVTFDSTTGLLECTTSTRYSACFVLRTVAIVIEYFYILLDTVYSIYIYLLLSMLYVY